MNRRTLPQYGMTASGPESLRQAGVGVISFMDSVSREPHRLQPHYHAFFQIFLLQGRAHVMHDFVEFEARGSTVVFLSPGQIHTARPCPGLQGTTVSFTQAFYDHHAPPPSQLLDFPFFYPTDTRPWLNLPPGDPLRIAEVFADLLREFNAAEVGAAEALRALLHLLLVRVHRLYLQLHPVHEVSAASRLIRQFHLAVEQHFREFHDVPDYAHLLGITPNHLHDVVREHTGRTAGDIIRQRRLLDAKRLLLHSELGAAEIAYALGFQDPSYFSRFFKRMLGLSPAAFRDTIREKHQQNAD